MPIKATKCIDCVYEQDACLPTDISCTYINQHLFMLTDMRTNDIKLASGQSIQSKNRMKMKLYEL